LDKLELHAKGLTSDNNQLRSLQEQWKNVLRKTKLDLTALMGQAKREYEELMTKLIDHLRESYDTLCHVSQTRHEQFARKKLKFLAKRACIMNVNKCTPYLVIMQDFPKQNYIRISVE
jgi:hypothetical protein